MSRPDRREQVAVWDRALKPSEIAAVVTDPWGCLFRPHSRRKHRTLLCLPYPGRRFRWNA